MSEEKIPEYFGQSLYIGDLSLEMTEMDLQNFFQEFNPTSIKVCMDKLKGVSLGYGYVNFATPEDAHKAFLEKNFNKPEGKSFRVRLSPAIKDSSVRRDSSLNLFVKNLPPKFGSLHLWKLFKKTGTISCTAPFNRSTGDLYGYGYLAFPNAAMAEAVKQKYDGKSIKGKDGETYIMSVKNYEKKSNRSKPFTNIFLAGKRFTVDSKESLEKILGANITSVYTPDNENKNFTAINFENKEDAEKALKMAEEEGFVNYNDEMMTRTEAEEEIKKSNPDASAEELKKLAEEQISELKMEIFQKRREFLKKRKQEVTNNPDRAVYVKNFGSIDGFDETKLRTLFEGCGEIESVKMMRNPNGVSRGFGYVNFTTKEAAQAALNKNGTSIEGKVITVAVPKTKEEREKDTQMRMQQQMQQHYMLQQQHYMLQQQQQHPHPQMQNFQLTREQQVDQQLKVDSFEKFPEEQQGQYLGNWIYNIGIEMQINEQPLVQIISALLNEGNITKMINLLKDTTALKNLLETEAQQLMTQQ